MKNKWLIFALLFGTLIALLAISNDSLWIDEGATAFIALQPTLTGWWKAMLAERTVNNMQLPLYHLIVWAWANTFGQREWILRLCNLPFFLVAVWALWLALKEEQARFLFALLFLCSNAFVWFYLDQARPYALLLAASTLLFAALYRFQTRGEWSTGWVWLFTGASLLMCTTSLFGLLWVFFALLIIGVRHRRPLDLVRDFATPFLLIFIGIAISTAYYGWSLGITNKVDGMGRPPGGFLVSLMSIPYEFMGFAGLGPSRNLMRIEPFHALRLYALPLVVLGCLWIGLFSFGRRRDSETKASLLFYGIYCLPAPLLLVAAYTIHLRLLPRHFTPLLPALCCLVASLILNCWRDRDTVLPRIIAATFLAACIISSLEIRFAPRHLRENYRHAAAVAACEISHDNRVIWGADSLTANYYGLVHEADLPRGSDKVLLDTPDVAPSPAYHVVFLTKPDVFDRKGSIRSFISQNKYVLASSFEEFQLWRSSATPDQCTSEDRSFSGN